MFKLQMLSKDMQCLSVISYTLWLLAYCTTSLLFIGCGLPICLSTSHRNVSRRFSDTARSDVDLDLRLEYTCSVSLALEAWR